MVGGVGYWHMNSTLVIPSRIDNRLDNRQYLLLSCSPRPARIQIDGRKCDSATTRLLFHSGPPLIQITDNTTLVKGHLSCTSHTSSRPIDTTTQSHPAQPPLQIVVFPRQLPLPSLHRLHFRPRPASRRRTRIRNRSRLIVLRIRFLCERSLASCRCR